MRRIELILLLKSLVEDMKKTINSNSNLLEIAKQCVYNASDIEDCLKVMGKMEMEMQKKEISYDTYPQEALKMAKEAAIKSTFQFREENYRRKVLEWWKPLPYKVKAEIGYDCGYGHIDVEDLTDEQIMDMHRRIFVHHDLFYKPNKDGT